MQKLKRFSILATRSQYAIMTSYHHLILAQFALQDSIEQYNAKDLAKQITDNIGKLFCGVKSTADLLHNSPSVKAIITH
jgi:hypothetical protein